MSARMLGRVVFGYAMATVLMVCAAGAPNPLWFWVYAAAAAGLAGLITSYVTTERNDHE